MRKLPYSFHAPYLRFGIIAPRVQKKNAYHEHKLTAKNSGQKSKLILEENVLFVDTISA